MGACITAQCPSLLTGKIVNTLGKADHLSLLTESCDPREIMCAKWFVNSKVL